MLKEKITPHQSRQIWADVKIKLFDLLTMGESKDHQKTLDDFFHVYISSEFSNDREDRVKAVMLYEQLTALLSIFRDGGVTMLTANQLFKA